AVGPRERRDPGPDRRSASFDRPDDLGTSAEDEDRGGHVPTLATTQPADHRVRRTCGRQPPGFVPVDDYSDVMSTARPRSAAFFDLDKTIIAKSSTLAFSRSFFSEGLINRRSVLRSAYSQFVFAISGADHD